MPINLGGKVAHSSNNTLVYFTKANSKKVRLCGILCHSQEENLMKISWLFLGTTTRNTKQTSG